MYETSSVDVYNDEPIPPEMLEGFCDVSQSRTSINS